MDDAWDLHAVVRSYTTATAANNTVSAVVNVTKVKDYDDGSYNLKVLASRNEDNTFLYPSTFGNSFSGGLKDVYKAGCGGTLPTSTRATTSIANVPIDLDGEGFVHEHQTPMLADSRSFSQSAQPRKRKNQEKTVFQLTREDLSNDLWAWRKYGQKTIKDSPFPSYNLEVLSSGNEDNTFLYPSTFGNSFSGRLEDVYKAGCGGTLPTSTRATTSIANVPIDLDGEGFVQEHQTPMLADSRSFSLHAMDSQSAQPRKRKNQEKTVFQLTREDLSNDLWAWRKYGQKLSKTPLFQGSSTPYNLAFFILKRMEKTRNKPKELLPGGILLSRLFKHLMSVFPELLIDNYPSFDHVMYPPLLIMSERRDRIMARKDLVSQMLAPPPPLKIILSHHIDENDDESSHPNSSSLSQQVSFSSIVVSRVRQNPSHESQLLFCYSLGSSRNAECSNCIILLGKIKVLEATVEMYRHLEQHILNSTALLHEVYNDMGKLGLG
nr:probable WRKY transcription factor 27 [Tanacetum cinerariifolium]